ncbi:Rop family plasmid primer RNA-binding protein [Klebsiella pneumoniae]|uniref:Rop family plasmid primer RNA-binding protein n=1 Tax=Klebsiella pneumoniae TaxID=573 RepID=A0A939NJA7_KLEPN|nr:Rop family plasmid primer RNA-binding protein [Klebsiella pneumoniae]
MTKQQKTALNMAKFIQNQSLLLLEKLNELDLDVEADLVRNSTMMEHLFRTLSSRLDELQDGN